MEGAWGYHIEQCANKGASPPLAAFRYGTWWFDVVRCFVCKAVPSKQHRHLCGKWWTEQVEVESKLEYDRPVAESPAARIEVGGVHESNLRQA